MKRVQSIDCGQGAVRSVRYNSDGEYCITTGSDKTIKLWNPQKKLILKKYEGHRYDVLDAVSSHDNSQSASGSKDKSVMLWDVTESEPIRRFRGHDGQINCVLFNRDSSVILSASFDGNVRLWDVKSKSRDPIQILNDARDSVTSLAVSEHEIITGSLDNRVRKYDLRMGCLSTDDMKSSVGYLTFTRDGQCVLVNCLSDRLLLLDMETGEVLQELKGHKNCNYRIEGSLLNNDAVVLSGSEDGFVYAWSLTEGKILDRYSHVQHRVVHSVSCHPSKPEFLAAAEGSVYLWEEDAITD